MSNGPINFKDKTYAVHWLETALDMEKEKYATCLVKNDLVPDQVNAQAWGYVVVGYSLAGTISQTPAACEIRVA